MKLTKILGASLIGMSVMFLAFQTTDHEKWAAGIRALAMVLLTTLYLIGNRQKSILFSSFLVVFTIADIFNFISFNEGTSLSDAQYKMFYFFINILYIFAYSLLILRIFSTLNVKAVFKKFPLQIFLLIVLGIFCVHYVSVTVKGADLLSGSEYALEMAYNAIIVFLMCLALINYMYRDDQKAIHILIGSIFIVFSEVLQLAYFYVAPFNIVNVMCSVFFVLAFLFLYMQSRLKHQIPIQYTYDR